MNIRYRLANTFVWLANRLVKNQVLLRPWPLYREVDTNLAGIGHKYACGAYSYEYLSTLVEQDGPKGFGQTATIKWLISGDSWKEIKSPGVATRVGQALTFEVTKLEQAALEKDKS